MYIPHSRSHRPLWQKSTRSADKLTTGGPINMWSITSSPFVFLYVAVTATSFTICDKQLVVKLLKSSVASVQQLCVWVAAKKLLNWSIFPFRNVSSTALHSKINRFITLLVTCNRACCCCTYFGLRSPSIRLLWTIRNYYIYMMSKNLSVYRSLCFFVDFLPAPCAQRKHRYVTYFSFHFSFPFSSISTLPLIKYHNIRAYFDVLFQKINTISGHMKASEADKISHVCGLL